MCVFVLRLCHRHHSEGAVKHVGPHHQGHHVAQLPHIQRHVRMHGGLGGVPGSVSQNGSTSPPYICGYLLNIHVYVFRFLSQACQLYEPSLIASINYILSTFFAIVAGESSDAASQCKEKVRL